eukprot:gnl/TRDRNA2_/TRDRNA2_141860_c3_seq1.p1 gnl/TRDRNA2_/TRDRNA2_141860_c3~~gnl/TRDRNA2_/TRDRNA2_141860_c3_seq1.p1  ORF type:complete len:475 (-),score=70.07 gnl/TRDRNA2_/TRDRNA2_141860_c3_seq1:184-1608(-)
MISLAKPMITWAVPFLTVAICSRKPSSAAKGKSPLAKLKAATKDEKDHLVIKRLNHELELCSSSMTSALRSSRLATLEKQRAAFVRTYATEFVSRLNESQLKKLADADHTFETKVCKLQAKSDDIRRRLCALAAAAGGVPLATAPTATRLKREEKYLRGKLIDIAKNYSAAEAEYVKAVSVELPSKMCTEFCQLLSTAQICPQQDKRPFLRADGVPACKPHIFCLQFHGGSDAKQVESLRREVTGVIRTANATRKDEVVLRLTSPGGTVTGYGQAAAQLVRIKSAGLKLTICVEGIAASGGYMMACVADHLVASPMAMLGSIGVVVEVPNLYERLKREGVRFLTLTAGKYKSILSPFTQPKAKDEQKCKEQLKRVWSQFKSFVKEHRPALDVERYGTGETWMGRDALERKLCDEIANSDDVILQKLDSGAEIFNVKWKFRKDDHSGPIAKFLKGIVASLGTFLFGDGIGVDAPS